MREDRFVLAARVAALRQDLALAAEALDSDAIRADLRESVAGIFGGFFDRKRTDLDALATALAPPASADTASLAEQWRRLEEHAEECGTILREYRAFIEGALVRSARLDGGICDLADALLRQLSRLTTVDWSRFTIVAEDEFFAPMTDIIRVRYPHFTVWNLPVLAHEFGHFVLPQLRDRLRGTDPLGRFRTDTGRALAAQLAPAGAAGRAIVERSMAHLDEYMADTFALYAAGPSFACTCIVLRFEPLHSHEESAAHPSDAKRAYLQLALLRSLGADYAKIAKKLQSIWQSNQAGAGVSPGPESDQWLDDIAPKLWTLFQTLAPKARLEAADWRRAIGLSLQLAEANWSADAATLTPRDILNGAWLSRLQRDDADLTTIGRRALDLARQSAAAVAGGS
jgi:hypothetical protein